MAGSGFGVAQRNHPMRLTADPFPLICFGTGASGHPAGGGSTKEVCPHPIGYPMEVASAAMACAD